MKLIDLTGTRFGRLVVVSRVGTRNGQPYWLCECLCGTQTFAKTNALRGGLKTSCGCARKENIRTPETVKEYPKLRKEDKEAAKNKGGFVGGALKGGRRKRDTIPQIKLYNPKKMSYNMTRRGERYGSGSWKNTRCARRVWRKENWPRRRLSIISGG